MARTGAGPALQKGPYSAETRSFALRTQGKSDIGLQWIQYSGAGTATITIRGTIHTDDGLIAAADPADIRWVIVPAAVFASLPAGAPGSDMLFAADSALVALLVTITFAGSMEFEFVINNQSRGA